MANMIERMTMVKAMEFIARNLNDEDLLDMWLMDGVADGDVQYGDVSVRAGDDEVLEFYTKNENFPRLMQSFLLIMKDAVKSGGLYCDGVQSFM